MTKVQSTHKTYITEDYDEFELMPGNRNIDPRHVTSLKNQILKLGNLIDKFPIVVNEKMQVLDGQHRLQALKELGEPVVYEIREGLSIDDVRNINTTHKNWSWRDYAISFSDLGNENYTRLLNLYNYFGYGYSVLMAFAGGTVDRRRSSNFYDGSFELKDQNKTFRKLKQLKEYEEIIRPDAQYTIPRDLALAFNDVMKVEGFDHDRMKHKLEKFGKTRLHIIRGKTEYVRALEEIYNNRVNEAEKVRLF